MNSSSPALSQFNIQSSQELTWNVTPLLHQIRHALDDLFTHGKNEVIDLRSMPLAPGEEEKLLEILGLGEIKATLNALGPSEIIETRYAGVWIVTHYNEEREILSRHIEITLIPGILLSQKEDIKLAREQLANRLNEVNQEENHNEQTLTERVDHE